MRNDIGGDDDKEERREQEGDCQDSSYRHCSGLSRLLSGSESTGSHMNEQEEGSLLPVVSKSGSFVTVLVGPTLGP